MVGSCNFTVVARKRTDMDRGTTRTTQTHARVVPCPGVVQMIDLLAILALFASAYALGSLAGYLGGRW